MPSQGVHILNLSGGGLVLPYRCRALATIDLTVRLTPGNRLLIGLLGGRSSRLSELRPLALLLLSSHGAARILVVWSCLVRCRARTSSTDITAACRRRRARRSGIHRRSALRCLWHSYIDGRLSRRGMIGVVHLALLIGPLDDLLRCRTVRKQRKP